MTIQEKTPVKDRISIARAADYLGYNRRTVHRYIKQGIIKVRRTPGGLPFFTMEDLEALRYGEFM